ncbi:hypothetical protein [Methylobacterium sp. AMS5]|uniref:hypothetical protein n=1 Tax=Methylobacterium sp. AMS5 TaxID=925818 RepID=UPI00074F8A57|nr:hypothetical protein [Methylobacterium sp. AMS5]AMB48260.1 hypothetical protein Y590_25165 [Methylobacterium sp. AMS5]
MKLPLRTFWLYSKNIDRLSAERDLRLLQVMAAAQSPEAYSKTFDKLQQQMGTVVKMTGSGKAAHEEELDRAGLAELKAMSF